MANKRPTQNGAWPFHQSQSHHFFKCYSSWHAVARGNHTSLKHFLLFRGSSSNGQVQILAGHMIHHSPPSSQPKNLKHHSTIAHRSWVWKRLRLCKTRRNGTWTLLILGNNQKAWKHANWWRGEKQWGFSAIKVTWFSNREKKGKVVSRHAQNVKISRLPACPPIPEWKQYTQQVESV